MLFSLYKSILSLLLQGTYSWVRICTCPQCSARYFAFPFWTETCQRIAAEPDCSLSTCSLSLLVQSCFFICKLLNSKGKYFSAFKVFTAGTSISASLYTFLFLSHITLLNSVKVLTLYYALKPTQPPGSSRPHKRCHLTTSSAGNQTMHAPNPPSVREQSGKY